MNSQGMSLQKAAGVPRYGVDDTLRIIQSAKRDHIVDVMILDGTTGDYTTIAIDKTQLAWLASQFPIEGEVIEVPTKTTFTPRD